MTDTTNPNPKPRSPGRPKATTEPAVQVSTRLPAALDAKARRIGNGSLVEGLRRALRAYPEPKS
jgi:hypothetical protein